MTKSVEELRKELKNKCEEIEKIKKEINKILKEKTFENFIYNQPIVQQIIIFFEVEGSNISYMENEKTEELFISNICMAYKDRVEMLPYGFIADCHEEKLTYYYKDNPKLIDILVDIERYIIKEIDDYLINYTKIHSYLISMR